MFGCSHTVKSQIGNVSISLKPEDRPEFARTYNTTIGNGFRLEITLKTYTFGSTRSDWSQLHQRNGKYIMFDAHAVADKIIDRELYPLVQAAVDEILRIDREFIDSKPSEFIDDTGAKWKRVN